MKLKGINKGVLKAVFASTLLTIASQQVMAASPTVDAFDKWVSSETNVTEMVYPVVSELEQFRDQAASVFASGSNNDQVKSFVDELDPGADKKIDIALFYALKNGDLTALENILTKVEQAPEHLLNVVEHAESLERSDVMLGTLKRIGENKELEAGHLLSNSGYEGKLEVALYVIENLSYSDRDLMQALQDAESSNHFKYMHQVLRKAEANPENDLGHILDNLSYKEGVSNIGKLLVQKFGYQADDLRSAVNNAHMMGHEKYAETLLMSAKADPSNDMGSVLHNVAYTGSEKIGKLVIKKFGYNANDFAKAVDNAASSFHMGFVEMALKEGKADKSINFGEILEQAADTGELKIGRMVVQKFSFTPEQLKMALQKASENGQQKFMQEVLKRADSNKTLDLSDVLEATADASDYKSAALIIEKFKVSSDSVLKSLKTAHQQNQTQYVDKVKSAANKHLKTQTVQAALTQKAMPVKVV